VRVRWLPPAPAYRRGPARVVLRGPGPGRASSRSSG